jgi:protein subunit release factor A
VAQRDVSVNPMDPHFPKRIYGEAKKLFPEGAVETLVARAEGPAGHQGSRDLAVRLVHSPTGIEVTCDDFPSQTENYIAAAIRLGIACDQQEH